MTHQNSRHVPWASCSQRSSVDGKTGTWAYHCSSKDTRGLKFQNWACRAGVQARRALKHDAISNLFEWLQYLLHLKRLFDTDDPFIQLLGARLHNHHCMAESDVMRLCAKTQRRSSAATTSYNRKADLVFARSSSTACILQRDLWGCFDSTRVCRRFNLRHPVREFNE